MIIRLNKPLKPSRRGYMAISKLLNGTNYWTALKRLLLIAACVVLPTNAWAQWTTSGSNIYNSNSGNVGIGTTTPIAKLDVNGMMKIEGSNVLEFNTGNETNGIG